MLTEMLWRHLIKARIIYLFFHLSWHQYIWMPSRISRKLLHPNCFNGVTKCSAATGKWVLSGCLLKQSVFVCLTTWKVQNYFLLEQFIYMYEYIYFLIWSMISENHGEEMASFIRGGSFTPAFGLGQRSSHLKFACLAPHGYICPFTHVCHYTKLGLDTHSWPHVSWIRFRAVKWPFSQKKGLKLLVVLQLETSAICLLLHF